MSTVKFHLLFLLIIFGIAETISATLLPMTKPNCVDHCGNISIPFPFGTTESCFYNSTFLVRCNETSGQLYWQNSTIEIKSISLDRGQLRVTQYIAKTCYAPNGAQMISNKPYFYLNSIIYSFSTTANKFTVIGCDSYGYISGWRWSNRSYSTGCIDTCTGMNDLEEGSCTGSGCCQTSEIPQDIRRMNFRVGSFDNHTGVMGFNNCTYAFLVEEGAFKFSPKNLTSLMNVDELPLVVDWVIGKETCNSAKKNLTSYACISPDSECFEPIDGEEGYRCRCMTGYEGNPYLSGDDGCQDINECESTLPPRCMYKCKNTRGNSTCICPKGYILGDDKLGCNCPKGSQSDGVLRDGGCIRGELHIYKPVAGAALGIILVLLFSCLLHLVLKKRRSKKVKHMYFLQNGGMLLQEKLTSTGNIMSSSMEREMSSFNDTGKIFSSSELERATNNFHSSMIVGQGGFGTVYKGVLDDHRIVAIKKSKEVDPTQIEQFINEVVVLSRVSHRNIVKLLGCCLETPVPLLVYEFVNNGTLYEHIHNPEKKRFVHWNLCLKIATETAEVLSYLHSAASTPIIHRDVKSANILLDHNFEAKVSDFGGSRLVPIDQTQLSTMVQGTFGYLDPEYMQTNQLTEKSDVYSFSVVLLELLTGLKALSYDRPENERNLTNFFLCKLQQGHLLEVLDETIVCENENLEQITEVAKLAQVCINLKGKDRPSMKQVAMELEGLRTSGRSKHSWVRFEENVEEMKPFRDGFADGDGFSTSIAYDSYKNHNRLSGGR